MYGRGLVEFHAGRYAEALQLFDRAVEADPNDPVALYYRGVTRGRLNDYVTAAADLRAALDRQPDLDQAALELGIALVQSGQYAAAIAPLEQAARIEALAPEASLFLGIARLRLDDPEGARRSLAIAATDPKLAVAAHYYQGVIDYRASNWSEAEERFSTVRRESPTSEMGRESAAFLSRLEQRAGTVVMRPYSLYGTLGFEYDSNVQLAPDDDSQLAGVDKDADGRATILLGGRYSPWRTDRGLLTVGYEFFQSLHFDLTDYNLQDHRPFVELSYRMLPVRFGLTGRYDYYLAKTDSFLSQPTVFPWLTYDQPRFGRTELFYRMRYRDYLKNSYEALTGFNHSPGIRQVFELGSPERYAALGYRYDRNDTTRSKGDPFGYDGQEINVGAGTDLPADLYGDVFYAYRYEDYANASDGRKDHQHQIVVSLQRPLGKFFDVRLAYYGTFNDSNQSVFEYDRNIVSLAFGARY